MSSTAPAPPPPTNPPAVPPGSNRILMLILSYLLILGLVPLIIEKDDGEIQWHAKNGLVLFGAWIAAFIVLSAGYLVRPFSCLMSLFLLLLCLLDLALIIAGIAKALKGERFLIPGLSRIADRL